MGLLNDLRDRARLVVNETPAVGDALEMVGRRKRRAVDDLDAEHARTVAVDDRPRFGADDLRPLGFCRMSRQLPITVARPTIAGQPGWIQEMVSSSAHIRSMPATSPVAKAA